MGNIVDYIAEYGDRTIDELAFNEVDSLILSQFSYLKFDKILNRGGTERVMSVGDLPDDAEYEELYADARFEKVNRELLTAMIASRRFAQVALHDYVNIVDPKWEIQFSAITCVFENGFVYVAFRGTDETLTGWKEDFNMAFMTPVPAQTKAVQYLNMAASRVGGEITVGGHSKGGNLAVYASMMCNPSVRDRITDIYSHDGPGFAEGVLESKEFDIIRDRIRKTVPGSSVVGMVLQTQENYEVVRSRNIGLLQHNPFNWLVDGVAFKKEAGINRRAYVKDVSVNRWIAGMSNEKRQEFVEILFEIIRGSGVNDLNDLKDEPVAAGKGIMDTLQAMDDEEVEVLAGIIKDIANTMKDTVKEYVSGMVDEEVEKYKAIYDKAITKINGFIKGDFGL